MLDLASIRERARLRLLSSPTSMAIPASPASDRSAGAAAVQPTSQLAVLASEGMDDRRRCRECRHYRQGRCGNHRFAGLDSAEVGRDFAGVLQRCAGFEVLIARDDAADRQPLLHTPERSSST